MAYNEFLADRIRNFLKEKNLHFEEKAMMGGLTYMVNDKMCVGIVKDDLMVRVDPLIHEELLKQPGCREMDFTGRPMKGFLFLSGEAYEMDAELEYWIGLALEYNPKARSSKKKS